MRVVDCLGPAKDIGIEFPEGLREFLDIHENYDLRRVLKCKTRVDVETFLSHNYQNRRYSALPAEHYLILRYLLKKSSMVVGMHRVSNGMKAPPFMYGIGRFPSKFQDSFIAAIYCELEDVPLLMGDVPGDESGVVLSIVTLRLELGL